jgi:hypothetical protein
MCPALQSVNLRLSPPDSAFQAEDQNLTAEGGF